MALRGVSFKVVTITELALSEVYHFLKLGNAVKDEEPTLSQVVTLDSGQLKDLSDDLDVLVLDFPITANLRKLGHRSDKSISFGLHVEVAADFYRVGETFNAEGCRALVICLFQKD